MVDNTVKMCMNYLLNVSSLQNPCDYTRGLNLIIAALSKHCQNRPLQIAGTAAIFYIIRNVQLSIRVRRQVVEVMLDGECAPCPSSSQS